MPQSARASQITMRDQTVMKRYRVSGGNGNVNSDSSDQTTVSTDWMQKEQQRAYNDHAMIARTAAARSS